MKRPLTILSCATLLLGTLAGSGWAGGLSVIPNGDQGVLMVGSDITGAQSGTVSFDYNQTLGEPWVSVQGGTLVGAPQVAGGRVTFAIEREDPDAAIEVDVRFEHPGNMERAVSNVSALLSDGAAAVPMPVEYGSAEPPAAPEESPGNDPVPRASQGGKVDSQAIQVALKEVVPPQAGSDRLTATQANEGKGEPAAGELFGVLALFSRFHGTPGLAAYARLFDEGRPAGVRQEPAIALSGADSRVTLYLPPLPAGALAPNFQVLGGELVSLDKGDDGGWKIGLLLWPGSLQTVLRVVGTSGSFEYAVVVAPQVASLAGQQLQAEDFLGRLQGYRDGECAALRQPEIANLCDFIFTANVLARGTTRRAGKNVSES